MKNDEVERIHIYEKRERNNLILVFIKEKVVFYYIQIEIKLAGNTFQLKN